MTKLYALGAGLLILSLAAPALADDAKPAPSKVVAAPVQASKPAPSPMAHKAKPSDDRLAGHEKDDDHKDRKDHKDRDEKHDEKHDKERPNDRD